MSISGPSDVNEGVGTVTYTVTLSNASATPVTVNFGTANGTALAGSDYGANSGTLTFAAGETSKTITVSIVNDNPAVRRAGELPGADQRAQWCDAGDLVGDDDDP